MEDQPILDNFLKAVTNSEFQVACQLGIFLIAAALVSLMTIRLLISLVIMSTERMKKQWLAQPPEGADQSLTARLFGEFGKPPASQALLSNEVRNMLEKHSSPDPKPGNN